MILTHTAAYDIKDLYKVFDVTSLKTLIKSIVEHSNKQNPDEYDVLAYRGDCFEVFAEFFFRFFNGDDLKLHVADYTPNFDYDNGVDGRGICTKDGLPALLQHKFKQDPTKWLTNDDNIANMDGVAMKEKITPNGKNIIIFTTARGVHHKHIMSDEHVTCINYDLIRYYVDENVVFWRDLKQSVLDTNLVTPDDE